MADVGVFSRYKGFANFQEEAAKNSLASALIFAKLQSAAKGDNLPAAVQITNEMEKALREGNTGRFNMLSQVAKSYNVDRGMNPAIPDGYQTPSINPAFDAGVNPMLPTLARVESGNNPDAVSPKGAAGEYQIMPATALNPGFGVKPLQGWDGIDPRTAAPEEQKRFANDYLNAMQARNGGDPRLAAASYNAGPGRVDAALKNLPAETQNYVQKVAPSYRTGTSEIPGFADTAANIAATKKRAEDQAQKDVELRMNPQIKAAEGQAKNIVKAREDYAKVYDNYITSKTVIDRALASPGLDSNFGVKGLIPNMPGGEASDAAAILAQIEGGAFLTAFETLKGGGQITEVEGEKATNSVVRMRRAQSANEFRSALGDYMDVMDRGLERARKAASGEVYTQDFSKPATPKAAREQFNAKKKANQSVQQPKPRLKYNPATGDFE